MNNINAGIFLFCFRINFRFWFPLRYRIRFDQGLELGLQLMEIRIENNGIKFLVEVWLSNNI